MAELEVLRTDVFTEELLMGNPAAIVMESDSLDEVQMQRIASEMGSPSTAFVMRSRRADLRLRYFSEHAEDPLSGHATIGAIWSMVDRGALGAALGGRHRVETASGVLPFSVESGPEGPRRVWMTQKRPMFAREGDIKEIASALGIGVDGMFHDKFPVSRATTGLPFLLVPAASMDVIKRIEPRREELTALSKELDVFGVYVYTWNVVNPSSTVHARCFLPMPMIHEDPASGLAAGALGAFLVENELIAREKFGEIVVEQGHWINRPSKILVSVERRGGTISKVDVGGSARISFRGRLTVP